jgi:spore germination protein KB
MNNELIKGHQLMALLFLSRLVPVVVTFPIITGMPMVQDAWLVVTLSTLAIIPVVLWLAWLGRPFPRKTMIEYNEDLLGKTAGKLLSLLLGSFLFFITVTTARQIGEAYTVAIMPETPIGVFIVVIVLLGANAARGGLELVARLADGTFWVVLAAVVAVLVLPANAMRPENLRPMLAGGLRAIAEPAWGSWVIFLEFLIVGVVAPFLTRPTDAQRFSLYAVAITGAVGIAFAIVLVSVFGVLASALTLPVYSLSRLIAIGEFFERVEIIPMGVWTISAGIKIAFFLWANAVSLARFLGLRDHQSLIYPLAILVINFSIILFDNIIDFEIRAEPHGSGVVVTAVFLLSAMILSVARLLKGRQSEGDVG